MPNASTIYSSGGVPAGDSLRINRTSIAATTETTILNVASGGCLVKDIIFDYSNTTTDQAITSLKVTIDGAAERTLISTSFKLWQVSGSTWGESYLLPLEINATTSCVIKVTFTDQTESLVRYYVP